MDFIILLLFPKNQDFLVLEVSAFFIEDFV